MQSLGRQLSQNLVVSEWIEPKAGGAAAAPPFSPPDQANLLTWVDAQTLSSLFKDTARTQPVTADADSIGAWNDKVGNLIDHYETIESASANATYNTNIINGFPAVRHNTGDGIWSPSAVTPGIGTGNFHIIMVMRRHGTGTGNRVLFSFAGSTLSFMYRHSGANVLAASITGSGTLAFNSAVTVNTNFILELWRDSGTLKAAINGVQQATTHATAANFSGTNRIYILSDPSNIPQAYIGELFFYKSFSAENQTTLRSYLNTRWGNIY